MSSRVKTRLGGQGKYSPEQVDATLKLIDELPVTGSPAYGLPAYLPCPEQPRSRGCRVECLKREIVICEKRDDVPGFKRLVVQTDAKRKRQSFIRSEDTMTMAEAQALLNMTYETTQILVKQGHLGDVDTSPKQVLISKKAVEDFADGHAKASDFGHAKRIS